MNMATAPIHVTELGHRYGKRRALAQVDFTLQAGEFLALLGPNGAGKTTLFSLLTRLLRATEGRIELFGLDLQGNARDALRRLGVVFQQPTLDLDLTVAQNLAYHGALQGLSPDTVRQRMEEELGRFGLSERAGDRVRSLNGGHRRRVEIARALLHEPKLLLLDEATAGLDLETRQALYEHVRSLCEERAMAVLWTTHLVEELSPTDATLILHQGRLVAQGTLQELQSQQGISSAKELLLALTRREP